MAGKEGEKRSGILETYKKFNIVTLPIGVAVGAYGIFTGNPFLARLGFLSAAIDVAQIVIINRINKKKESKPAPQEMHQSNSEENVIFLKGRVSKGNQLAQAA